MPQLRKDPIIGRWVIIATERAKRPDDFKKIAEPPPPEGKECPFCEGKEHLTPPEIFSFRSPKSAANTPGWQLRVVSSIAPVLHIEGDLDRHGQGVYDVMNGIGAHEIVIESPKHIANMSDLSVEDISRTISCYIQRINDLGQDPRFKYVLIFKNYGWVAGGGHVRHTRSQLIATPVTPKRVKEKLVGAHKYFEYHERCVFCDLIKQELNDKQRIIAEIDGFIAMTPFASRFPFEVVIYPKKHACDFTTLEMPLRNDLANIMKIVLTKLKVCLNDPPYNYLVHTAPFRRPKPGYWRTIDQDFHWHIEITPRLTRVAGFEWGTGFYICPVQPEEAAKFLRETNV
jgi:UDPglucose--hexose-1-phosphate uridylyltransferase